jgi:hypothetical protein
LCRPAAGKFSRALSIFAAAVRPGGGCDPTSLRNEGQTVKYMLLIYSPPVEREPTPEEWAAAMPAWEAFGQGLRDHNAYVDAAPLAPTTSATTIRIRDGNRVVTDGPFAETKEWLGGYYIIDVPSLDQALEAAAMCPGAKDGSVEIRPLVDLGP